MRHESTFNGRRGLYLESPFSGSISVSPASQSFLSRLFAGIRMFFISLPRQALIGALLLVALLAFEIFNFDTTQFALSDLLGEASFMGLRWATILAIAFCAIDFAGLAYLVGLDRDREQRNEVWYLMGAWLLGATMNALMTWWAVSVTLISHEFGNEVIGREDLLLIIPVLVAVLVWLTRILFIGTFSVAGSRIFGVTSDTVRAVRPNAANQRPPQTAEVNHARDITDLPSTTDEVPAFLRAEYPAVSRKTSSVPSENVNDQAPPSSNMTAVAAHRHRR